MDDVCSQENTQTPEGIEKLWSWFGETLAQLDPGCRLFVIGTLHHFADIYCRIQKDAQMRKDFEFSIHAWRDPPGDPEVDNGGEIFFPSRLTPQFVARQKRFLPPRLYACFYENVPTSEEDRIFHPDYFKVIKDDEIPNAVWTYILTDFAFIAEEKKKGKADRCAFWVISLDVNRYAYVRDVWMGRWKPSDSVRIVCDLWNNGCQSGWNMKGVAVELTTHNEILQSVFEEVRRQTFIHPKIIPIQGRSQEVKDMRIEASEPKWRRGEIYFAASFRARTRRWSGLDRKVWRTAMDPAGDGSGEFNPDRDYPADEMHRADHQGGQGQQLWKDAKSVQDEQRSRGLNIFRKPQQPPTPPVWS